jgi:hypothetical protein
MRIGTVRTDLSSCFPHLTVRIVLTDRQRLRLRLRVLAFLLRLVGWVMQGMARVEVTRE